MRNPIDIFFLKVANLIISAPNAVMYSYKHTQRIKALEYLFLILLYSSIWVTTIDQFNTVLRVRGVFLEVILLISFVICSLTLHSMFLIRYLSVRELVSKVKSKRIRKLIRITESTWLCKRIVYRKDKSANAKEIFVETSAFNGSSLYKKFSGKLFSQENLTEIQFNNTLFVKGGEKSQIKFLITAYESYCFLRWLSEHSKNSITALYESGIFINKNNKPLKYESGKAGYGKYRDNSNKTAQASRLRKLEDSLSEILQTKE